MGLKIHQTKAFMGCFVRYDFSILLNNFIPMPALSKKGLAMPASPIRKLVPYAEAAKKRGVAVIHLNIGQPDIKTPEIALNAVRNTSLEVLA